MNGIETGALCGTFYGALPRHRLGLAFCVELRNEANILEKLLADHGFDVTSTPCTALAVKDRLVGNNPLAAVYALSSYCRALR